MQTRTFPCESCGADLEFGAGAQALACPYCGFRKELAQGEGAEIREQDLEGMLERLARGRAEGQAADPEELEVRCSACSAAVVFRGTLTTQECVYCGSPVQRGDVHRAESRVAVDAVLPFGVEREPARVAVGKWLRGLWFAPGAFLQKNVPDRVQGVYLPYWTFDALTFTRWRGKRGVRRKDSVRWSSRSGSFQRLFDDTAVPADRSLPASVLEHLEPWPFERCVPYRPEYLAGYFARTYDVPLEEGFKRGRARMEDEIERDVRRRIGGDEQRVDEIRTRWDALTFKHLLLPVWILAIRYRERSYRVFVNAATGEVQGERPWSAVKLTLAGLAVAALVGAWLYVREGRL